MESEAAVAAAHLTTLTILGLHSSSRDSKVCIVLPVSTISCSDAKKKTLPHSENRKIALTKQKLNGTLINCVQGLTSTIRTFWGEKEHMIKSACMQTMLKYFV